MQESEQWLAKCFALGPSEREVARREFAKIKAGEEQGARDLRSHMEWLHWNMFGHQTKEHCNQGRGTWMVLNERLTAAGAGIDTCMIVWRPRRIYAGAISVHFPSFGHQVRPSSSRGDSRRAIE